MGNQRKSNNRNIEIMYLHKDTDNKNPSRFADNVLQIQKTPEFYKRASLSNDDFHHSRPIYFWGLKFTIIYPSESREFFFSCTIILFFFKKKTKNILSLFFTMYLKIVFNTVKKL
jgi:hypothetical protein